MGTIQCSNSSTLNKQNSATVSLLYTQKLVIPIRWWQNLQSLMKTDWNHYGFLFLCFALMLYPFSEWSDFLVGQEIRFIPIRNWGSALLWIPRGLGVQSWVIPQTSRKLGQLNKQRVLSPVPCPLSTVHCLLSSIYCILSTVFCFLSTVFCLLSTVLCLLSSIYYSDLSGFYPF